MRRVWLSLTAILFLGFSSYAQVSTEGTDFWLGFMQNADGGQPSSLEIFITSNEVATGTINVLQNGSTQNFSITPGSTFKYVVSNSTNNQFAASGSGNVRLQGIHIVSDVDVSVYAFNKRSLSADATVILPTPTLGKDYIVAAYFEESNQNNIESEFLVVGTEDGTVIEITPSQNTLDGNVLGVPFTVTLNRGETIQIQARADLTGSLVKSASDDSNECKNFAVFGGNKWTRIGNCGGANDHLYEQMFPVNTWGKNFTLVPFLGRNSNGDEYRIIASEASTKLTITTDGGGTIEASLIEAGTFVEGNVSSATSISADKPIQVVQYSKSQCAEVNLNQNSPGDPFMLMVSPNEQLLNQVTFNTLESAVINNYYTTIITKTSSRNSVTLTGGAALSQSSWNTLTSNPELSYARIGLTGNQNYTLTAPDGFISYVYGFGVIESFGYAAGASLANLNLQVEGVDETIGLIIDEGCLNSEAVFTAVFATEAGQEPRYDTFEWDFGDGSTGNELNATHTYAEAGVYDIVLTASSGTGACGTSESITRSVTITDVVANDFIGPGSVCPDVSGVTYSISGPADNTYEWAIIGGTITSGGNGPQIIVDWGAANDNASISVTPMNYLGCIGETITLPVKINKRLEPALPTGPAEVCFTDFNSVEYSTPVTAGSEYEWFVIGGTFLTPNASNAVTIQWDGVGIPGQLWYREFNPAISDCEGFSEVVNITVYSEINVVGNVTDVLCFGDSNGKVDFGITGGKPGGYRVEFMGNPLPDLTIDELEAGTYEASIFDALDCEVLVNFTVGTPATLAISGLDVLPVRCFQEENGEVLLTMAGGTRDGNGDYSYMVTGNGRVISGNSPAPLVTGLAAGSYSISVVDANGCQTSQEFVVNEPLLLEPDLETLINQPICPDASNGTAFVDAKGGTAPYQFFWSNNSSEDIQQGMNFSRGSYTVRIVDANGCETSLPVDVTERFPRIFIPNAFSPNGDGENDEFKPVTDCDLNYNVKVFNQWGSIVYVGDDIFVGWDGTLNGKDVPSGKYSYMVFYSGNLNGVPFQETIRGTLRLLR